MSDLIEIVSERLSAAINPVGAELTHLRDASGRELMTDADPAFWTGHAPILFPVIGCVNNEVVHIDGVERAMPKHGFARHAPFTVVGQDEHRAVFRLAESSETRAAWPFRFVLEFAFEISGATLSIEARIGNPGDTAFPASFGFHPAFAWPLPFGRTRADHRIVFDADEPAPLRRLTSDGLIAPEPRPSPVAGRTLPLADHLFTDDALIWDQLASRGLTYGATDGPQLRIEFPDTPMLGVWTKPGAGFICVEPWHGIADPVGYAGEMADKPGVFEVPPGGEKHIAMRVTLTG